MKRTAPIALSLAALVALAAFAESTALAHGGGLNAQGCHNNRKTGDYHCHRAPAAAPAPRPAATQLAPARGTPVPARRVERASVQSTDRVSYANCSEARAAGAAPVYRGDPGYAAHLDRDNDGVSCE